MEDFNAFITFIVNAIPVIINSMFISRLLIPLLSALSYKYAPTDGKFYTIACSMRSMNLHVGHSLKNGLDSLAWLGLKWPSKLTLLLTFSLALLLIWNLT